MSGGGVNALPMRILLPVVIAWEPWTEVGVLGWDMLRGGVGKRLTDLWLRRRGLFVVERVSLLGVGMRVSCSRMGSLGGRTSGSGTGFREIDPERLGLGLVLVVGIGGATVIPGRSSAFFSVIAAVSENGSCNSSVTGIIAAFPGPESFASVSITLDFSISGVTSGVEPDTKILACLNREYCLLLKTYHPIKKATIIKNATTTPAITPTGT